jgi:transposase
MLGPDDYRWQRHGDRLGNRVREPRCPILPSHSLLILDQARFHRPATVTSIAEAAGHQVLCLPPDAPDFNKIEHDFAALKKRLSSAPEGTTLDAVVANYRCA